MNFFKKLSGKSASKSSSCCNVEIKEVTEAKEGPAHTNENCCTNSGE
ncbi:hypothetical protein J7E63_01845 [Bacillus sp. ISL-75]|nr:hypothetical protein [Bacillus sp. ISL-75]MBT2725679.1 hypothetical protein [Bacillus sp. ISL-75]